MGGRNGELATSEGQPNEEGQGTNLLEQEHSRSPWGTSHLVWKREEEEQLKFGATNFCNKHKRGGSKHPNKLAKKKKFQCDLLLSP